MNPLSRRELARLLFCYYALTVINLNHPESASVVRLWWEHPNRLCLWNGPCALPPNKHH